MKRVLHSFDPWRPGRVHAAAEQGGLRVACVEAEGRRALPAPDETATRVADKEEVCTTATKPC
jgi:hypothetical protein